MNRIMHGIPAAGGIAIGPAFVYRPETPEIPKGPVDDIPGEQERLLAAIAAVDRRLSELVAIAADHAGDAAAEIFEVHRMFLADPALSAKAADLIAAEATTAEAAVVAVTSALADEFASIGDDYFAERAIDVRDIGQQLVRELMGLGSEGLSEITVPSVVIADDLTPSDTMSLPEGMALAFCTKEGSATSHAAILARSMGIPAIVGITNLDVATGTTVAVDGDAGLLYIDPDTEQLAALREQYERQARLLTVAAARASEPAVTVDGHRQEVVANIGSVADAERADRSGAEGVGLLRTEFLFIDRGTLPTEDEQYEAYRSILELFGDRPVVVRTLDVGGDKQVPGINLENELNPFLGKRGIRLTLAERDLFQKQLRALLRAGVHGNLKIMFPMVATLAEVEAARAAVGAAAAALDSRGIERAASFEIGIMIEVPSAALIAGALASRLDFFSIGTNDLTQYTLAVDRTNAAVATIADPLHPAVLRLIQMVIEAAHAHGKWVGLCGEMAGDPVAVPILLGLGLDEWSMNPPSISVVKDRIRSWSTDAARTVADRCLQASSTAEVRDILMRAVPS
ncbi:MAG: phosphoenolpyruvate--protein phosphotransferase [Gammaproteobacteria bacterium]|nr:phosphoenolpyruvate--protein phosphotransferase [Gammaproteobacteria bacterium]